MPRPKNLKYELSKSVGAILLHYCNAAPVDIERIKLQQTLLVALYEHSSHEIAGSITAIYKAAGLSDLQDLCAQKRVSREEIEKARKKVEAQEGIPEEVDSLPMMMMAKHLVSQDAINLILTARAAQKTLDALNYQTSYAGAKIEKSLTKTAEKMGKLEAGSFRAKSHRGHETPEYKFAKSVRDLTEITMALLRMYGGEENFKADPEARRARAAAKKLCVYVLHLADKQLSVLPETSGLKSELMRDIQTAEKGQHLRVFDDLAHIEKCFLTLANETKKFLVEHLEEKAADDGVKKFTTRGETLGVACNIEKDGHKALYSIHNPRAKTDKKPPAPHCHTIRD